MDTEIIINLLVSLAIGVIIGFEREWKTQSKADKTYDAGLRTFAVVSFLGGISAVLSNEISPLILPALALGLSSIIFISYRLSAKRSADFGYTTEVTLLLVFAIGAFAAVGYKIEAIAFAAIVVTLLRLKSKLHVYIKALDADEVNSTIQLLLLAAVAIPLLPNKDIGPGGAINPRTIGILILLIAGISYFGYFSVKLLGNRLGIFLTALLGGLTSSTAVAVAFSKMASTNKSASPALLGGGISLAAAMMGPRLLIMVGILNYSLLPFVSPVLITITVIPMSAVIWIALQYQKNNKPVTPLELKNPLQLGSAAIYGIVLSILFLVVHFIETHFGAAGVYALAATSGIADVDAISITLAKSAIPIGDKLTLQIAANGILIAVFANTIVKAIISQIIGGWRLAKWCGSILLLAFLTGIAVHLIIY
jgi:uncharacterized membrane protein (DUF4010 family)